MTTSGLNLTPGDLAYWKRQLEREAQMRRYGNNIQSQVPAHIRQALEQQAAPQSSRNYPWPGQYPTRKQELPKDITGLPNWSEDDIRQLDPQIRQELFGSWQTDLIPATIRLSKIFKREEEDKQIQAQMENAKRTNSARILASSQSTNVDDPNAPTSSTTGQEPIDENKPSSWDGDTFTDEEEGYHEYWVGPTLITGSWPWSVSTDEMLDLHHRFAYPGQDPSTPVIDQEENTVYDPRTLAPGGRIRTTISDNGYTITNKTLKGHLFYNGIIERTLMKIGDDWYVQTYGTGNNFTDGIAEFNAEQGKEIFEIVDASMIDYFNSQRA